MGEPAKLQAEAARLKSLNHMLDATGQEAYMYEDWVEETINLLEKVSITPPEDIPKLLLGVFNNLDEANSITQHFRVFP